jgi:hypothetical protein
MTDHSTHGVKQERDRVETSRVVTIGAIALVIFAVGIYWAVRIQKDATGAIESNTGPRPTHAGRLEVGMVYQPPFETNNIAADKSARARARLESAGYNDAEKQTAHIPIERAMRMLVERGKL